MTFEPPPRVEQALAHAQFLRAVARGVLGGDAEVEDVLQETFLVAMRKGPEKPGALRAWLGTVARRLALDRRRSGVRRGRRETEAARPEGLPSPDEIAAREETRRRLVEAVLGLEEPYRTTLLWRYYAAKPLDEIARLQDVPVGTVRSRLHRGLTHLRERLDSQHGGDRRAWSLALAPLTHAEGTTTAAAAVAGGIVLKKVAAAAAVLLLAAGGYVVATTVPHSNGATDAETPPPVPVEAATALDARDKSHATLSAAGPSRERATAPPAAAAQPFTGRVFDPEGRAVANATVEARFLYRDELHLHVLMGAHETAPLASTVTDADGHFGLDSPRLPGLTAAKGMMVRVVASSFATHHATVVRETEGRIVLGRGGLLSLLVTDEAGQAASEAWARVSEGDGDVPTIIGSPSPVVLQVAASTGGRLEIRLPPGHYRARVQARGLRLIDTGVLVVEEGRTTEQVLRLDAGIVLQCHVVDESGEPVRGAVVQALGPKNSGGEGTTDADGRCRVPGISLPTKAPMAGYDDDRVFFAVTAAGFARLENWRLLPPEYGDLAVDVRLERGVVIRVRVVDSSGSAVPDAGVTWLDLLGQRTRISKNEAGARVAGGVIEMPRVRPGPHRVAVVAGATYEQSAGPGPQRALSVPGIADRFELLWKDIDVGPVDAEVEVVLARLDGAVAGTVLLPDESPAREGSVHFEPMSAAESKSMAAVPTKIDAEGHFRLERLRTGKGDLIVRVPGRLAQKFPVEIPPAGSGAAVTLRLRPGKPIAGRVVDRNGAPVADLPVRLMRNVEIRDHDVTAHSTVTEGETRTGADGAFAFTAEDGPVYRVGAGSAKWIAMQGSADEVRAGAEGLVIRLKPFAEGYGMPLRIIATSAGAPYEGRLQVTWKVAEANHAATEVPSDSGGGRRFGVSGTPGAYDFTLYAPGHLPTPLRGVDMAETAEGKTLEVALDRGAVIRLRVRDADGRPLANTWVEANNTSVKTDARGECDSGGWPPGAAPFRMDVALASDSTYTRARVAAATTPASADVKLRRRGFVAVRLGMPFATLGSDVVLRLVDATGTVVDEQRLDAAGTKEWRGEAQWTLYTSADGGFRVLAERGEQRGEAAAAARVGQTVEAAILWK